MPKTSDAIAEIPDGKGTRAGLASPLEREAGKDRFSVLYAATIFVGAFLLFQVQLLLGKLILPWFGGTPTVWTVCLLFFQVLLLAGYAYAHWIAGRLSSAQQAILHLNLIAIALFLLLAAAILWPSPISPGMNWRPKISDSPTWAILRFLLVAIGLPFFLLSTTGPLLQKWFSQSHPGRSPYRLYALSNLGSLLGLLSYPFVFEPNLSLHAQAWAWTATYLVYLGICALCAAGILRVERGRLPQPARSPQEAHPARPKLPQKLLWTALAGCASLLLLATTNMICQEVAVIPFLWVVPLSLYLISFVICFDSERWYRREIFHPLLGITVGATCVLYLQSSNAGYLLQLVAYTAAMFAGCMVCHGELARTKPHPRHLTSFYLLIATGGALGGVFVGLVAPRLFSSFWEFPLGMFASVALLLTVVLREPDSWWHRSRRWVAAALLTGMALLAPAAFQAFARQSGLASPAVQYGAPAAAGALAAAFFFLDRRRDARPGEVGWVRLASVAALLLLGAGLFLPVVVRRERVVAQTRSFYGVLTLVDEQPANYLVLRHGRTVHGVQFRDRSLRREATAYYALRSGVNILLRNKQPRPLRVGLVGMGAGTLAALGQAEDYYRFYEINPDVIRWAASKDAYFTFISDSAARVDVVPGDARLSLEREASRGDFQKFDVIVLDAFNSDAIPLHLLTREAFLLYLKHLRGPDSVIAAHISNRSLDLGPVLAALARASGMYAVRVRRPWLPGISNASDWVLLSRSQEPFTAREVTQAASPLSADREIRLWTDDYSNLLQVLR